MQSAQYGECTNSNNGWRRQRKGSLCQRERSRPEEGGEEKDEGDKDEEEGGLLLYNCSTVHFELCNTVL